MGVHFSCLHAFIQWRQARAGWIFHPSTSLGSFGSHKQASLCMQARNTHAHSFYLGIDDFGLAHFITFTMFWFFQSTQHPKTHIDANCFGVCFEMGNSVLRCTLYIFHLSASPPRKPATEDHFWTPSPDPWRLNPIFCWRLVWSNHHFAATHSETLTERFLFW